MGFFDDVLSEAKKQAASVSSAVQKAAGNSVADFKGNGSVSKKPWDSGSKYAASTGSFFQPIQIIPERWNKIFPYRLLVVEATKDGYVLVTGSGNSKASDIQVFSERGDLINFVPMDNQWVFNLPITPQQYSISQIFSITNTATLRGIVEEHGGARYKMITCAGTFGVWPQRRTLSKGPENPTLATTLLSGTIEAMGSVITQVNNISNAFKGQPGKLPTDTTPEGSQLETTGYYQMLLLDQFLEQYLEAKRKSKNKNLRLVFDIPKENQSFLVTPMEFTYSKSADSPNEGKFRFSLKAWKRIDLKNKVTDSSNIQDLMNFSPDLLSNLINATEAARRSLGASYNLIKAVRSDFRTPFDLLREASLFAKDLMGLPFAAIDLPRQIIQDAESSIKESLKNLNNDEIETTIKSKNTLAAIRRGSSVHEGISDSAVASGQIGLSSQAGLATDPVSKVFQNPEENFDLFNALDSDGINFSFSQQERIDADIQKIRETTVDDLIKKRNQLLELALQISNAFGSGDDTYSDIYLRPKPYDRVQSMTIDEYDILNKIYDAIQAIDSITATNEIDQGRIQNAFEYVGSLATDAGFVFETSSTKIRVPVPYGLTIEQISARYLGDPDRWLEIVTLNNLRSPYIDENGFFYSLLSNADGRQFNVSTDENLFVGQKITLSSLTQPQVTRRIINIEKIASNNFLITVDGLDNLDVYKIADLAKMRAYLPGTINSQDQVFVPSNLDATDTVLSRPVPASKGDPLVGLSKIDWLITDSGDIATDAHGDFRLAFGMSNIMQALKMKFATPTNRLLKHPAYGAGLNPGVSVADLNDNDAMRSIIRSIQNDSRFGQIISLTVEKKGPTFAVAVAVALADGSGVFPISFILNN